MVELALVLCAGCLPSGNLAIGITGFAVQGQHLLAMFADEAAAAIMLALVKSKGMADRFSADHPFIFLIRENATGTILFPGRASNPAA